MYSINSWKTYNNFKLCFPVDEVTAVLYCTDKSLVLHQTAEITICHQKWCSLRKAAVQLRSHFLIIRRKLTHFWKKCKVFLHIWYRLVFSEIFVCFAYSQSWTLTYLESVSWAISIHDWRLLFLVGTILFRFVQVIILHMPYKVINSPNRVLKNDQIE